MGNEINFNLIKLGYLDYVRLCTGISISSFNDLTKVNWESASITKISRVYR